MFVQAHYQCDGPGCEKLTPQSQDPSKRYDIAQWIEVRMLEDGAMKSLDFCSRECLAKWLVLDLTKIKKREWGRWPRL